MTPYVSACIHVLLAVDRFVSFCHPFKSVQWRRNVRPWWIGLLGVWLFNIIICIPVYFSHGRVRIDNPDGSLRNHECIFLDGKSCEIFGKTFVLNDSLFIIMTIVFSYALPFTVIAALYGTVMVKITRQRNLQGQNQISLERRCRRTVSKLTRLIAVILLVYLVTLFPKYLADLLMAITSNVYDLGGLEDQPAFLTFEIISQILAYTNSCVNPIIYFLMYEPLSTRIYNLASEGSQYLQRLSLRSEKTMTTSIKEAETNLQTTKL